ncbi:acetyltransferase [Corynebacterium atypicum]|uniref:Acetyltransferase n=1 Tax=Corynebacterium atypicum TaxID=191610 RepID=A0ABN4DEM2_9CORY|nr:acetyltransferase [Corynebacterium atypicum]
MSRIFRTESPAVGSRVVVRRRVPGTEREVTDVIGHVLQLDPLVVRPQEIGGLPSQAEALTIDPAAVVTIRVMPDRTVKNADIRAVEVATARAFPGLEHRLSRDGQWLLRHGDGVTERSNSASPIGRAAGFGAVPLAEIMEFYARVGAPAIIQIPERIARPAERLCAGPEWRLGPEVMVMTRSFTDAAPRPAPSAPSGRSSAADANASPDADVDAGASPEADVAADADSLAGRARLPEGFRFACAADPDDTWFSLYHFRGQALPHHALELLSHEIDDAMAFGRILAASGETAAIARATITSDDAERSWLGLSAIEVAPAFRRLGLGAAVTAAMLDWGREHGAGQAFLQVVHTNQAGVALYRRLGFAEHHRHRYAHHQGGQ